MLLITMILTKKSVTQLFTRGMVVIAVVLASGCASFKIMNNQGEDLVAAQGVYTLVNLHPDENRGRLYATNYQQAGLIPMCSRVFISEADDEVIKFENLDTKREYHYFYHKSAVIEFDQHLLKVFGKQCDKSKVTAMSKVDQEGIEEGVAKVGMTKDGVILAIGYPPMHRTPSLEANRWLYWKNRFGRMRVEFEDGLVSKVVR